MNFIEVYDNALTSEQCKLIIDYMNGSNKLKKGETMGGVNTSIKDSYDLPLSLRDDDDDVNNILKESLLSCIDKYVESNSQLKLICDWGYDPEYNLQKYEPGGGYHDNHCEMASVRQAQRVGVWMFYLNTVTEGGGTRFDNFDYITDAVEGRCVIWPAYWTHFHHGITSHTQTKYIATGWLKFHDHHFDFGVAESLGLNPTRIQ